MLTFVPCLVYSETKSKQLAAVSLHVCLVLQYIDFHFLRSHITHLNPSDLNLAQFYNEVMLCTLAGLYFCSWLVLAILIHADSSNEGKHSQQLAA
jgi:hypothetical protein